MERPGTSASNNVGWNPSLAPIACGLRCHETSHMFFIHNVPRSRVCTHTHMHTLQILVLSFHALFVPLLQVLHTLLLPDRVLGLLGSGKLVTVFMGRNVFEGKGCVLLPYIPRPGPASGIELMSIYYCWTKCSLFFRGLNKLSSTFFIKQTK